MAFILFHLEKGNEGRKRGREIGKEGRETERKQGEKTNGWSLAWVSFPVESVACLWR